MGVQGIFKDVFLEVVFRKMDSKSWIFKIKSGGANRRNADSLRYGVINHIGFCAVAWVIQFFTKRIHHAHLFTR